MPCHQKLSAREILEGIRGAALHPACRSAAASSGGQIDENGSLRAHLAVKAALWAGHVKAMVPWVKSAAVVKSSQPLAAFGMELGTTMPAAAQSTFCSPGASFGALVGFKLFARAERLHARAMLGHEHTRGLGSGTLTRQSALH